MNRLLPQRRPLRFHTQLILSFGAILSLLALTVAGGGFGLRHVLGLSDAAMTAGNLSAEFARREIDHLNWASELNRYVFDPRVPTLSVELDPTRCAFGRWYHGAERHAAERRFSQLAPLLAAIDEPHRLLHDSARLILHATEQDPARVEGQRLYREETVPRLRVVQARLTELSAAISAEAARLQRAAFLLCHVSENGSATGTCAPLSPIPTGCVALYALAE